MVMAVAQKSSDMQTIDYIIFKRNLVYPTGWIEPRLDQHMMMMEQQQKFKADSFT